MLEYSQRLRRHTRNVFAQEGELTGTRIYVEACKGGAQALGRDIGAIEVGKRADIVMLDHEHPDVTRAESVLDAYVFVAGEALVRSVIVGGEIVVADGRHKHRDVVDGAVSKTMQRLSWIRRSGGAGFPRIMSAAFSAIMITAALMLPPTRSGNTEASITRRPCVPCTRNSPSTTAISSAPMRQLPAG